MNPFMQQVLGSVLRSLLILAVPLIVSTGLWTPEEATQWATATAAVLAALLWSVYQKYTSRVQLAKALEAPQGATEDDLKDRPMPRAI